MAQRLAFKLVTPAEVVFDGEAELVIVVTTEGEEGILAHHAPFLAALRPGVLRADVLRDGQASRLELATDEGFMQALPDGVTVLVDEARSFDQVDVAAVRERLAAALDRQKGQTTDSEAWGREQRVVDYANAQLRLTGHR
jgi:F-type H+-transporting ATPase subunit epsilon